MTIVDTSVMVSVQHPQDTFHAVSTNWFSGYVRVGGVVAAPALLIPEVAGVITRRRGDTRTPACGCGPHTSSIVTANEENAWCTTQHKIAVYTGQINLLYSLLSAGATEHVQFLAAKESL